MRGRRESTRRAGAREGSALAELLVALTILAIGVAGATALLLLASREMERAEIAQGALLLLLAPPGEEAVPAPGGVLVPEGAGEGRRVRYLPHSAPSVRHPAREWRLHGDT